MEVQLKDIALLISDVVVILTLMVRAHELVKVRPIPGK
jgi:hypothetical protein